jgi:hypothetical protein
MAACEIFWNATVWFCNVFEGKTTKNCENQKNCKGM